MWLKGTETPLKLALKGGEREDCFLAHKLEGKVELVPAGTRAPELPGSWPSALNLCSSQGASFILSYQIFSWPPATPDTHPYMHVTQHGGNSSLPAQVKKSQGGFWIGLPWVM